jgi:thioredoxin-dependent peroxiredoxin
VKKLTVIKQELTMATWLEEGQRIPDLTLPADDGGKVSLRALKGKPAVVYFYPRDDTPGCTREACAFRDRKTELTKLGVTVLGVSTDDVKSHVKFRDKFSLNFPLLADVDHRAAEAFGAWQEKNMYGKKSMGVVRSTFLFDAVGVLRKAWRKVNVDGHDEAVIEAVRNLSAPPTKPKAKSPTSKKKPAKKKPSAKK